MSKECKLEDSAILFEPGGQKGLTPPSNEYKGTLRTWFHDGLNQTSLVEQQYMPFWQSLGKDRIITLSHDPLLYYQGILEVVPHSDVLFVRIRRSVEEFAHSFALYPAMRNDYYYYEPGDPGTCRVKETRANPQTPTPALASPPRPTQEPF